MSICRSFSVAVAFCVLAFAAAQAPKTADAEAAKKALADYKSDRDQTAKNFTKEELAAGDEQAAKAEKMLEAGRFEPAIRLAVDARWLLPVQPSDLPANVSRVLGYTRLRHGDRVNALTYSPDGSKLLSASRDGTVRVWSVGNGRELIVYRGHEAEPVKETPTDKEKYNINRIPGVAVSADGDTVASCGGKDIQLWSMATGKQIAVLKAHKAEVLSVAFSKSKPDLLVSGGADKKFIVWDTKAKKPTYTSDDMEDIVFAVGLSPNDKYVAAGDKSGAMVVFELGKWDRPGYGGRGTDSGSLNALSYAQDGVHIFLGGGDKLASMLIGPGGPEAQVGSKLKKFEPPGKKDVLTGLAVSADGKLLVTLNGSERMAIAWDIETGKSIRVFQGDSTTVTANCVALRPDGKEIAVGFETGQIRVFPLSLTDDHRTFEGAKDNLWTSSFSPDGTLFAAAGADKTIRIYETASGTLKKELTGHKLAIPAIAFLGNGTIASAGGDKVVKIWDIATGQSKDATGHTLAVLSIAADPTGKVLISGAADKTVRGWNPVDGKELWKVDVRSAVCAIAINKDGNRVSVGTADGKLRIFDRTETGLKLFGETTAHGAGVSSTMFQPGGDRIVTAGGDGLAKLWTIADGGTPTVAVTYAPPQSVSPSTSSAPLTAVGFSPDGKQVVGGGSEGVVRIWDAQNGGEVRPLRGHTGWVTACAFSPDGKSVLSCAVDRSIKIFDLPRADSASSGHTSGINAIAVSRDGKRIATAGIDRTVKIWDIAAGRDVATLMLEGADATNIELFTVAFVGNDQVAATGTTGPSLKKYFLWDIKTGKQLKARTMLHSGIAIAASDDAKTVAIGWIDVDQKAQQGKPGKNLGGFELTTDKPEPITIEVKAATEGESANSVAVSPDAKWGVLGRADGAIQIWDLAKKEKIGGDWPIQKKAIYDMGITPDRSKIVVIDDSGEVRIGDTAKREVLATVKATENEGALIVSPTGDKFVTISQEGVVRAWDMAGKDIRTWKLPFKPTCSAFMVDGKRVVAGTGQGTVVVLNLP